MIASSNLSPPTRTEPEYTAPPSDITPTSVVPPPISTTIEPVASSTGNPAPIAAAIGSSINSTRRAPAPTADSRIARRSTWVDPHGTQITMRGLGLKIPALYTLRMKCLSISSVTVKSAITPSFIGRITVMLPGVRPIICLAASPTCWITFLPFGPPSWRIATTEGSSSTMPCPRTQISVFAVPRSIARSFVK